MDRLCDWCRCKIEHTPNPKGGRPPIYCKVCARLRRNQRMRRYIRERRERERAAGRPVQGYPKSRAT